MPLAVEAVTDSDTSLMLECGHRAGSFLKIAAICKILRKKVRIAEDCS